MCIDRQAAADAERIVAADADGRYRAAGGGAWRRISAARSPRGKLTFDAAQLIVGEDLDFG